MDILSRLGEAFRFEDLEAEDVIVDGVRARVATLSEERERRERDRRPKTGV